MNLTILNFYYPFADNPLDSLLPEHFYLVEMT